jgi:uncharacterized protein (TIGR02594 family)
MDAALSVLGLHEGRDTSRLVDWFDKSVSWIDPREIPWCGAFVATCHRITDSSVVLPKNPLGAQNWKLWGKEVTPCYGATLVFWRGSPSSWKGHVGFYYGEDETHFYVLGGNQSNAVTVTRIAKSRLIAARMSLNYSGPIKKVYMKHNNTKISYNEA